MRYFHPSDEAAAADWNSLAVLGSERVAAARTDAELRATLLALFRPLAPTLRLVPAGTNGNVNPFVLPGRYTVRWTGMEVRRLDGQPHHGVGVLPDVYVEKTLAGVRAGRDEFLEKAIELATSSH